MDVIKFGWDTYFAVDELTDDMILLLKTMKPVRELSGSFMFHDKELTKRGISVLLNIVVEDYNDAAKQPKAEVPENYPKYKEVGNSNHIMGVSRNVEILKDRM